MTNLRANKALGQHWLVGESYVRKILDTADVGKSDTVVEVGPGPGVLTEGLCERAGKVIAIELDPKLAELLKQKNYENLEVHIGDVLEFDTKSLPAGYHVVANVPYYITSAIIKHFLESKNRPASMTLTVQAEVAERIVAKPPRMSVLAVSVQVYGIPKLITRIPKGAFRPIPQVDSAVLRISDIGQSLKKTLGSLSEPEFFKVVKAGFAEKRKQLHNTLARNLSLSHDEVAALLKSAKIESSRRAETLTVKEWATLGKRYAKQK